MKRYLLTIAAVAALITVPTIVSADYGEGDDPVETTTTVPDTYGTTTVVADTQVVTTTTVEPEKKVFVCKYVGTPGDDERLQTGQNPISVSVNAIPDPPGPDVQIGDEFADAQGRSVVIAFDTGQPEPDVSKCPSPQVGTTTTSTSTTTTSSTTTTTTEPDETTTTTTCPDCVINTVVITNPTTTTTTTVAVTAPPPPTTINTPASVSTTTLPAAQPFSFGAAATVCVAEVPTIRITFVSPAQFPTLVGQTGTLTMTAVNGGATVGSQPLVYAPGTTVDILYPGTRVNADGSIADVPGWILQPNGLWVLDPSDTFLRDGITLTYVLNPTATATVTYPPESATCANPENPPPGLTPAGSTPPGATPPAGTLPSTGSSALGQLLAAAAAIVIGLGAGLVSRRRHSQ